MTDAEWLAAEDPIPLLAWLTGGVGAGQPVARPSDARPLASPRKLRLFACACATLLPRRTPGLRRPVEAALAFADGGIGAPGMEAARWGQPPGAWTVCSPDAGEAAYHTVRDDSLTGRRAEMAALLRDIFGNPFRPARLARCHWCGSFEAPGPACFRCGTEFGWLPHGPRADVPAIARRAYDERDFAALPVLADALEEAGCEEGTLLGHLRAPCPYCRDAEFAVNDVGLYWNHPRTRQHLQRQCACGGTRLAPHVRGCFALDIILGKS